MTGSKQKNLESFEDWEGKVPMQSLIFLVIETMAVRVTLRLNIS